MNLNNQNTGHRSVRQQIIILIILCVNFGLLLISYTLQFIEITKLSIFADEYSLFLSIKTLWEEEYITLAIILFLFSFIFPIVKCIILFIVSLIRFHNSKAKLRILQLLNILGKWSMLDVFVAAILIVLINDQPFWDAAPMLGLYLFAAAILLMLFISTVIERVENQSIKMNKKLVIPA